MDGDDYIGFKRDLEYCKETIRVIHKKKSLKSIKKKPPPLLMEYISKYSDHLQLQIDIYEWKPEPNHFDCNDLCALTQVRQLKNQILQYFNKHQEWQTYSEGDLAMAKKEVGGILVAYFTKYTDYIANLKIVCKDVAVS